MKWYYQGLEIGSRPGRLSEGAVRMQEVQLVVTLLFPEVGWDRQERHTPEKLTKTMMFRDKGDKTKVREKVVLNDGFHMNSL